MGVDPRDQALTLLTALGLGTLMGLLYDLIRPLRYGMGRTAAVLLDLLYCVLAGAAAFIYAMGVNQGRSGLWELSLMLLGFLLYLHFFSRFFLPVFHAGAELAFRGVRLCKKIWFKGLFSLKMSFKNVRK